MRTVRFPETPAPLESYGLADRTGFVVIGHGIVVRADLDVPGGSPFADNRDIECAGFVVVGISVVEIDEML